MPAEQIPTTLQNRKWSLVLGVAMLVMLLIGAVVGLYLTRTSQDLRQQAADPYSLDEDYECRIGDPNACGGHPERCHCTGGDACTGTVCDSTIEDSCELQGRSYCVNQHGSGMTCCSPGYVCCSGRNGCCPGSNPTPTPTPTPTRNPNPTPRPSITPTPTPTLTPTPTPVSGCNQSCNPTINPPVTCQTGLTCYYEDPNPPQGSSGVCRNPDCLTESSCICSTPTPTPTPTPVGPQCHNISVFDPNNGNPIALTDNDDADFIPGETSVIFVCSANIDLPEGYYYNFRIWEPCGSNHHDTPLEISSAPASSELPYSIRHFGDYAAQCAVCLSGGTSADCDWEVYTPTTCN